MVQNQTEEHNTDRNHAAHTDLQGLPSSERFRHPSVEEVPDLPVCQEHPEVPPSAPDPHRYPHRHMISIISRPPKSQLRHISGSDDHAPFLVSNIHQHLGTLSCL